MAHEALHKARHVAQGGDWVVAPWHQGAYYSGRYYEMLSHQGTGTITPAEDGRFRALPVHFDRTFTADRIAFEFSAAATAGGVVRAGIYANHASKYRPGALVVDAGTADVTGTPAVVEITINQVLVAGVYWLLIANQGAPGTRPALRALSFATNIGVPSISDAPADLTFISSGITGTNATGALPSTFDGGALASIGNAGSVFRAALRAA